MDKMKIYNHLPIWGQNFACFCEGYKILTTRYGNYFQKKLREYEERSSWSYDRICEYRNKKLNKVVGYCYQYVPFYKSLFDEYGINPDRVKQIEDLKVLPILTKDVVKDNIDNLISVKVDPRKIIIGSTGGTTGAGLRLKTTSQELQEQWAVWWRYRRWHGLDLDTWSGLLGGKMIVPLVQHLPPYWRYNHPNHQLILSSYHINEDSINDYAKVIKRENIMWLHGYSSSIAQLADFMADKGICIPLKWVSIGSENLYEVQRLKIKNVFGVNPIQHYGLSEGVANISENVDGVLSVDEDYAYVEFIPTENPNEYKIIGTTLSKYTMPLIRYDTGDIAIIGKPGKHNKTGRIVERINGREAEYVLLPGGGKVGAASISLSIHDFHFIRESQFIQTALDSITVKVVRNYGADDFDEKKLLHSLRERFGVNMHIQVEYVKELRREVNGKKRLVISEINI